MGISRHETQYHSIKGHPCQFIKPSVLLLRSVMISMMSTKITFPGLHALLALLFILIHSAAAAEASWEYSYDPCSDLGPANWGYLHEEWATCATGEAQTPVSIKPSNIYSKPDLGSLQTSYTERIAFLQNKGHEIMVNWTTSPGYLVISGKVFHLRQCHWHSPSEHELYGKRYPLELHMVHTTDSESNPEIAVVGVLFELRGLADPFLDRLSEALRVLKTQNEVYVGSVLPPRIDEHKPYFRYTGSLTTPPCSEPVVWTVMREVKSVTEAQLELLRAPVHHMDNARPIQPINGRQVFYHTCNEQEEHASS